MKKNISYDSWFSMIKAEIRVLISQAIQYHKTQDEIIADYDKIISRLPKRFPVWQKHVLSGFFEAKKEQIEKHIVFGYRVDGAIYTTQKTDTNYYGRFFSDTKALSACYDASGFFYAGTNKPYHITKNYLNG